MKTLLIVLLLTLSAAPASADFDVKRFWDSQDRWSK